MKRPSPALVVALLALIVALGGTGYAATQLPKNSVGSKQVKNGSLKAKDIASGVVGVKSDVYYGINRPTTPIIGTSTDSTYVTIQGLPAGTYLFTGHVTLVKFGTPYAIVRCGIKGAGKDSSGVPSGFRSAAAVGGDNGSEITPLTTSMVITSTSAFDAQLYCRQDGTGVSMEEGRLIAQRVDSVSVRGGP